MNSVNQKLRKFVSSSGGNTTTTFDNNSNNPDEILQRVDDLKNQKDLEISTLTSKLNVIEAKLATKETEVRDIKSKLVILETINSATNKELVNLKVTLQMFNQTETRTNFASTTPSTVRESQLNDLKNKVEEIREKVLNNKIGIMETKNEMIGIKSNTDLSLLRLKVLEDFVSGLGNGSVHAESEKNVSDHNVLQDLLAEINQWRDQVSISPTFYAQLLRT
jgi:hypothetical protein